MVSRFNRPPRRPRKKKKLIRLCDRGDTRKKSYAIMRELMALLLCLYLQAVVRAWSPSSSGSRETVRTTTTEATARRTATLTRMLPGTLIGDWKNSPAVAHRRSRPSRFHVAAEGSALTVSSASLPASSNLVVQDENVRLKPLLDFSQPSTVDLVDRLDDVIMGGISSSTVVWRNDTDAPYAQWFGMCREDGGGFCGWRTNPFRQALIMGSTAACEGGLYVKARLSSDDEPERRVWKLSTRTRPDRGEELYQAPVPVAVPADGEEWTTAYVPFDSFRLVRGPRTVEGAPPLNVSNGMYQIGMTMSKFVFGNVTQELGNFRPGFFALDLKEIGVYYQTQREADATQGVESLTSTSVDDVVTRDEGTTVAHLALSKTESEKRRPWLVKYAVLPFLRLVFFSEQSQRRKAALQLLATKRGLARWQALRWGWSLRRHQRGSLYAIRTTAAIAAVDALRFSVSLALRVALVYPLRLVGAASRWFHRKLAGQVVT